MEPTPLIEETEAGPEMSLILRLNGESLYTVYVIHKIAPLTTFVNRCYHFRTKPF